MKATVAQAVHAFQTTEEYNIILFQWYFKGFELLRRYLIKHSQGTDLEELDFEAIDKEIEADEVAQVATLTKEVPQTNKDDGDAPQAFYIYIYIYIYFFLEKCPFYFRDLGLLMFVCLTYLGAF